MAKGKFCTTHPETPAAGRCIQCHRPYCDACETLTEFGSFCSEDCAETRARYRDRESAMGPGPGPRRGGLLGKAVLLAILAALAYGGWAYFLKKDPDLRRAVDDAVDAVQENAP